jgi:BirA family biotin operon repressor/biotin-[acetyl-CoA-carboxylase] ligase
MESLDKISILSKIDNKSNGIELEVFQQLNSTNTYLLEKPLNNKVNICLAEHQSSGRGRHGKIWHSPKGANIYISFAHRLNSDMSELSGLSLMLGIILAKSVQLYCKDKIQLKWPNDLLVNGKKLAGILVEIKSEANKKLKIISGIGLNVQMSDNDTDVVGRPSICLNECHPYHEISRNELVATIISNILPRVAQFDETGFSPFHEQWNKLDAMFNQQIELTSGDKKVSGIHNGINKSGELILDQKGKLSTWSAGEVSLRSKV